LRVEEVVGDTVTLGEPETLEHPEALMHTVEDMLDVAE
jgi:hypothetical protein